MTKPIKKKYVTDTKGNKTGVILDLKTYEQLIDEIDELNCSLGYDQAKKEVIKDINAGKVITIDGLLTKQLNTKSKRKVKN